MNNHDLVRVLFSEEATKDEQSRAIFELAKRNITIGDVGEIRGEQNATNQPTD